MQQKETTARVFLLQSLVLFLILTSSFVLRDVEEKPVQPQHATTPAISLTDPDDLQHDVQHSFQQMNFQPVQSRLQ